MRCRCGGAEKGLRFTSRVNVEVQSMCIGAEVQRTKFKCRWRCRFKAGAAVVSGCAEEQVQRCRGVGAEMMHVHEMQI
jgi:hypothetical protein